MANWTLVEGTLSDGLPMRLFIGERDGMIAAASVCDDQHPRTEDEFLWLFGTPHTRREKPAAGGSRPPGKRVLSWHANELRPAISDERD